MDYSVYSYGGGEILWKVFNGIAILFDSDSPYFTSVGKLTMLIGLFYVAAQAFPRIAISMLFKNWFLPTLFLTAIFFGPKSNVHIIDKVDSNFQYSKVPNIPIGIALVSSFTTHVSEYLTDNIEVVFTDSDSDRFSTVGPMFASRLINEARSVSIKDPMMRENIKDFSRQCFAWPYVFSNITPGKRAALESTDILGFIEKNPHPLLGVYWRDDKGNTSFKTCNECCPLVKSALSIEVDTGLKSIAMKLFDGGGTPEEKSSRLKLYSGNAWQSITKDSSDFSNVVQQELMINGYREALQDKRDELGMGRMDDSLIYMNAERGRSQQNASFLVKAAMSGIHVPTLHTILFALAIIYFAMIAPMTFLPKGLSLLVTWVKVMAWLSTWPVLLSILNSLGQMFASKAAATQLLGSGGLSLMTQTGLSDVAFDAYSFVMGLQWAVPPLSWALISGGGYAFSQMATSFTQGGEAFAGKVSSEMVDGNVSFDSQSIGNKSIANTQMAQQQLGPSINMGSRFDDGKIASLHGPNGQTTIQEHQTSLGTNVSQNDGVSTQLSIQSGMSKAASEVDSKQSAQQIQKGFNETFGIVKSVSDSTGSTDTFGNTVSTNDSKSFNDAMNLTTRFAKDNKMGKDKAFKLLASASLSANPGVVGAAATVGGPMGALAALAKSVSIGASGQMDVSASDHEALSKSVSADELKQFGNNLVKGFQDMEDHKSSISNAYLDQKMKNATESFQKGEHYSDSSAINLQESQSLNRQASISRQKSLSAGSNLNDPILEKVAQERYGGDIRAASNWQAENPEAYQRYTSGVVGSKESGLQSELNRNGFKSERDVENHYKDLERKHKERPTENERLEELKKEHDIDGKGAQLKEKHTNMANTTRENIGKNESKIVDEDIKKEHRHIERKYNKSKEKYLITKAVKKTYK